MVAQIINGKEIAQQLRQEMKEVVSELQQKGISPHLTVIMIGEDPASHSYVNGKEKAAAEIGMDSKIIRLEDVSELKLLAEITRLNQDPGVHGILVQLPLPDHISETMVIEAIDPNKDVDGFHPVNIGRMLTNQETFYPCTPYGIIYLLKQKKITIVGQHAVIMGRSNIVGKPVGQLLLNEHATVTYCHSHTKDIKKITKQADILIVAIGKAHIVDDSYIKENAVVIDVGVNRTAEGKLTGDVDFDAVKNKASFLTPVPKGVGPMTITMLLYNTIKAAQGLQKHA
jgi:methylenetetrahydrofolate dehydrogenase (NADP+)/methenyltetrahydrofolate cyclohydrolase